MQPQPDWRKKSYWFPASRFGAWIFHTILPIVDRFVFRFSHGRNTIISTVAGLPSIMLTTTGRKSGQPRLTPLVGVPHNEGAFIIIGSNFGQKHHPAWVYNLRANPHVTVGVNGNTSAYFAREVSGQEREDCWQKAAEYYSGYNAYKKRAGREIAVFVLEPQR